MITNFHQINKNNLPFTYPLRRWNYNLFCVVLPGWVWCAIILIEWPDLGTKYPYSFFVKVCVVPIGYCWFQVKTIHWRRWRFSSCVSWCSILLIRWGKTWSYSKKDVFDFVSYCEIINVSNTGSMFRPGLCYSDIWVKDWWISERNGTNGPSRYASRVLLWRTQLFWCFLAMIVFERCHRNRYWNGIYWAAPPAVLYVVKYFGHLG